MGAFGVARRVKHVPSGTVYAMKKAALSLSVSSEKPHGGAFPLRLQKVLYTLMATTHKNVVHYCGAFYEDKRLKVFICLKKRKEKR